MPPTDQEAVQATLIDFEPAILSVVHGAWQEFKQLPLTAPLEFARTRACFVQDIMVRLAKEKFADESRVRISARDETVKFVFDDKVLVRFKKADASGLGSNISTQAIMQFVDQQRELPGLPDVYKVEVLYHLNHLQTQIDHVMVVARDGDSQLWEYAITAEETVQTVMFPAVQDESQSGAKVKIRKPDLASDKKQSE